MITVIDYGMGNLKSLTNAFNFLGEKVEIASSFKEIERATKIVFPGVGNFGKAARNLKNKKIDLAIKSSLKKGVPFLGICLGLQLLFDKSEEAKNMRGLGILKGDVLKFKTMKIPQIGWNQLEIKKKSRILEGVQSNDFVYFMHSFFVKPCDEKIIVAVTNYEKDFCSAVECKNIFGVQFHPEKSGELGLQILKNFSKI